MMNRSTSLTTRTIVGVWRLLSLEIRAEDGTTSFPFGTDAEGVLIYTASGLMSVQMMRKDRLLFASGDQQRGTAEEIAASFKGCISYYGSYHLDHEGGVVVHNIEGSLFPNWEGVAQKRFFTLSEDRLTLTTPPTLWGGYVIGVVEWRLA